MKVLLYLLYHFKLNKSDADKNQFINFDVDVGTYIQDKKQKPI